MKILQITKNSNHNINKNNKFINKAFLIFFILINLKFCNTNNATTCYELYSNNTIPENCFNTTACCYLEYSFYEKNYTKCILKLNNTEDICTGVSDVSGKEGVSMSVCDCFGNFIKIYFYKFLFLIFLIV